MTDFFKQPGMNTKQIVAVTAILTAFVLGAYGLAAYSLTSKASKSYVTAEVEDAHKDAVGEQNLYSLCEADVVQAVLGSGGTMSGKIDHVGVKIDKTTATVKVRIKSDIYSGGITCTYSKSNWQSQGIQPTG